MQAILILAHTAPDHIIRLSKLLQKRFEIYVHFDKKTVITAEQSENMRNFNIHCYQEVFVNWGSCSIADATRLLMSEAIKNLEITHMHIISGQDWPVENIDNIYNFYENNLNIYLECYAAEGVKKSGEPIVLWQKLYYNYDKINRRTTFGKIYHRIIFAAQALLGVNKFKKLGVDLEIYHGSQWMDLPRDAVEYLLYYIEKNKNVKKVFETGFCSDEFWVQTILYNSKFRERIVSDNHRFIVWQRKYGSYPAILDESDIEAATSGNYHFCRKIVPNISEKFITTINKIKGNQE